MKKLAVISIVLSVLLLALSGCVGSDATTDLSSGGDKDQANVSEEPRKPLPYSVGNVKAISNQTEYRPLINWINGLSEGISADGEGMSIKDGELVASLGNATGELPNVVYSDDFRVVIDGESAGEPHYTLYNNGGELLHDGDSFMPPDTEGEYFLLVTLSWSNNDTGNYLAYAGYQYWFKIIFCSF